VVGGTPGGVEVLAPERGVLGVDDQAIRIPHHRVVAPGTGEIERLRIEVRVAVLRMEANRPGTMPAPPTAPAPTPRLLMDGQSAW
jgi:hypothetical protein